MALPRKHVLTAALCMTSIILLRIFGCGPKPVRRMKIPPLDDRDFSQRYVDEEIGFFFEYPPDWKLYDQLQTQDGGTTILVSPFGGKEVTKLNINVVAEEFGAVKTVIDDAFVETTRRNYEARGQEIIEITRGTVKKHYPAVIAAVKRKAGSFTVRSRQIIFIAGTRLFVVTLQGREDLYAEMETALNFFFEGFSVAAASD